jgi:hypothetical protein
VIGILVATTRSRSTPPLWPVIVTVLGALQPPRQISPFFGRLAAAAVTAVGGIGIGLGVAQSTEHFGQTLVVAFVLVAPTFAITRLLPSVNAARALIVGAAGAAVINALVAQAMLSANAWSSRAGVVAVGLIAALLWLVPTGRPEETALTRSATKRDAE